MRNTVVGSVIAGTGSSKYNTYEKRKSKENIENFRIQKIRVKPQNMKDMESPKIYKDIGKKLKIQNRRKYRRKVSPENTKARQSQKIKRKLRIKKIQKT